MPARLRRSRTAGWRMPAGAVWVGRPTIFGNPFQIADAREAGYHGSDHHLTGWCVIRFREWPNGTELPELHDIEALESRRQAILTRLPDLRGRDLVCWWVPMAVRGHTRTASISPP